MKPFLPVLNGPLAKPNLYSPVFTDSDEYLADVNVAPNSRPVFSDSNDAMSLSGASGGNSRPIYSDSDDYMSQNY